MMALLRALHAEALKLRGTLALALCAAIPLAVVALSFLMIVVRNLDSAIDTDPAQSWDKWLRGTSALWAVLMLPLFVTLQSALLAQLEHANQQWKHLAAMALPREVHYLAKWVALAAFVALANACMLSLSVAVGVLVDTWWPATNFGAQVPWASVGGYWLGMTLPSLLIVGIHTYIANRWRSFTVVVSIGMVASIAGTLVVHSKTYGHFYPWMWPAQVVGADPQHVTFAMMAGGAGGALALLLGAVAFGRRQFD